MPHPTPAKPTPTRSAGAPLHVNNLSIVVGELVNEPTWRQLPSGTTVLSCSLRTSNPDGPATAVPVVWYDPSSRARAWRSGDQVMVAGSVVRRFFRLGSGALGSATEVVVAQAELLSHRARVDKLRSSVVALLGAADAASMSTRS